MHYANLKGLQNDVNSVLNRCALVYYVTSLCFYAEAPYLLFIRGQISVEFFLMLSFYVVHSYFWVTATIYHKRVEQSITDWIQRMESSVTASGFPGVTDRLKLIAFAGQVQREPVGFACGNFTVSYHFTGSVSHYFEFSLVLK